MRPRYYVGLLVSVLLAVVAVVLGVYLESDPDLPGGSKYFYAFGLICAAAAWTGYETRFNPRRAATSSIRQTQARGRSSAGVVVVCALLAALFASLPLSMAMRRFARGHLLVTSTELSQRGWTFSLRIPWRDIVEVTPVDTGEGPYISVLARSNGQVQGRQIHKMWKQDRLPRHPSIVLPGKFLGTDPALVYAILTFYLSNPQLRAELDSGAAMHRVRDGSLVGRVNGECGALRV